MSKACKYADQVATVKNSSFTNKEIKLKGDPLYAHHISKGKFDNTHWW